ncbi:sporulation YhaL family protein [Fredinandcohnia quinoae]|uniref:Sporulation YhaL family protein n=1 Tax=Fredinandcohnia quinoae TaxID=2918902 RepID=A0AAW5E1N1_9BACI|nr:sporulation YhaL family protein [Fredinandcohnia sp. SECRCQ15]MCH1626806.1 sporulation YhaL family protein [Fredinandcohnia sp. SECRCQ15]
MLSIPWFVYVALFGVLFSAFMVIRTTREERQVDESFIEQEGNVYIERMNSERDSRTKAIKKPEPM